DRLAELFQAPLGDAPVEAGAVAGVTGSPADLLHEQEQGVAVAVDANLLDELHVAALLALAPELVPASREVHGPARSQGLVERILVHEGVHEDVSGLEVLGDRPDQSLTLGEVGPVHWKRVPGLITSTAAAGSGSHDGDWSRSFAEPVPVPWSLGSFAAARETRLYPPGAKCTTADPGRC